ncbi:MULTISPECIES: type 1 glutamine amidotransferase domain-containing protein [Pantoea]|uniref:Type 1 glutamine amidotransferase domain-containing protein n=1 Tax=Candidatus Pantoea gossypiicola TaxID=2608008 RepID=A0AB34CGN0_9GAMM|nr:MULTISPECIES: type 1 glutamine amidotransferase domain-containing protein [Pantoea]KAA5927808.1 type 1 glutamine amidotransferase domain-containing protein [Pantoea sp. VH_8]KAA5932538.1 type 1 glutamine amidotransferase domain-containing protein [Pantoea sp. VH_4]KAA5984879.1 type 1 glutamine amidotransferase domain-containing protein [Pantoea sp. M_4]KAA6122239.1 type 1 glutamine amidotransferase domain-containing protein [Pantoea gossypiicola]
MKPADKPVLCVVSSHPIKGASGVSTGFFLAELTHVLKVLEDAGLKTTIASIRGGQPPVDGFDLSDPVNAWFWNETDFQQRLASTPALSELNGGDYCAVFFAGGHGTMWDFRDSPDAQRIVREVYESYGVVSAVCHGPAALVDAKLSNGEYLVNGKNVAAFTNKEEEDVHTTDVVPFLLETALREHGALYHEAANWSENVMTDGRLITGQNPASAHGVGVALVEALRQTA